VHSQAWLCCQTIIQREDEK